MITPLACFHPFYGLLEFREQGAHFHGSFHGDVGALLLGPQNGLGRFKQVFAKLAMGHHDHSNHCSSRLSKTEMPMFGGNVEALSLQMGQHGLGHGHGAVPAARAAESHGQAVTSFLGVQRQCEIEKFQKPAQIFPPRLAAQNVMGYGVVLARHGPQGLVEIGVGQEAQIGDRVRLCRRPVLEAQTK